MNQRLVIVLVLALFTVGVCCALRGHAQEAAAPAEPTVLSLPAPDLSHPTTLEQALQQRRSVRQYAAAPITLQQASNLLWAAQGITEPTKGFRTAPSAIARYPLRLYLVAAQVSNLPAGAYRYLPQGHQLELVTEGDPRASIGSQPQMTTAPALLVYAYDTTVFARFPADRGLQWACLEAGHSAQNVLLEEVALGLVGVPMGAFDPVQVKTTLKLTEMEMPLYVLSAGQRG